MSAPSPRCQRAVGLSVVCAGSGVAVLVTGYLAQAILLGLTAFVLLATVVAHLARTLENRP